MEVYIFYLPLQKYADVMRRRFSADGVLHIYQRTVSGFNLFYSLEDFIVFYTIVSLKAKKYKLSLMGLCIMIDHVHLIVSAEKASQVSAFVNVYSSLYIREFNEWSGRSGPFWECSYGSSLKTEPKRIRSLIAYLFNNPVEKMLCRLAQDYKWNFLRFFNPQYKLSQPKSYSRALRRAIKIVNERYRKNMYLKHALLNSILEHLDKDEREYLTDFIIAKYFPFDTKKTCSFYKSYEDMIRAVNSNTGSEYDIREKHYCKTDAPYREMIAIIQRLGIEKIHDVIIASEQEKRRLFNILKLKTSGSNTQIRKFLHMESS